MPVLTLYGLGNILGAGIYVLVGKVAGYSGDSTVLAFVIAMVIAGLTAFSYMELSSRYPESASVSVYLHKAFGNRTLSVAIGLALVLGGVASAAALSKGFAGYLGQVVAVPPLLASTGLLVILGLVAVKGIGESAKFAALFTLVETGGLLLVVWAGRAHLNAGELVAGLQISPAVGLNGVLFGAFLAFYAFIGFEDMVNVVEEVKRPRVTMPLAILLSLVAATVLYMLVVLVSTAVVPAGELAGSSAPLSLVLSKVSAVNPTLISVIGIAATLNGVLVQIIMGSRILYGLANQGWLPKGLARVHRHYHTPVAATAIVTVVMIAGSALLGLVSLAQATSFLVLAVFMLVNVSLLVIKRREAAQPSTVRIPAVVPALGAVSCLGMVGYQLLAGL